jgi:protein involved in polysaccharide export with SLBB domain
MDQGTNLVQGGKIGSLESQKAADYRVRPGDYLEIYPTSTRKLGRRFRQTVLDD